LVLSLWLGWLSSVCAQQPAAPPQDPLMSLMLSQPRIDVDSPVTATATFDPPIIRPGELATYRVAFNALEESVDWPAQLAAPPQLNLRPGAHGQMLAMAGPVLQPRAGFNYRAHPAAPGQFTVPSFTVNVYGKPVTVPAAQLEVVAAPPDSVPPARRLILEIPNTNLFVGEPVRVSILFPALPGGVLFLPAQQPPVQITGQGFIVDQGSLRQRMEPRPLGPGGSTVVALTYELTLTPLAAGNLAAFAQAFAGNHFPGGGSIVISGATGPVTIPGGPPQYFLLDSDPAELQVRPLPRDGELPGFTGAVGNFTLDQPELSTNIVRVGDTVRLTVKVHGDANGNVAHLVPPPAPKSRGWQVFPADTDSTPPQTIQAQNFVTLSYTLIPLTEEARETPPIPFSYFAPKQGAYADLTIPSVPIKVTPGTAPADLSALQHPDLADAETQKEPVLSGLATAPGLTASSLVPLQRQVWFPLVQLAPASAFLGLWLWDRRRRYFEQHPNLVLRRQARRALRRHRRLLHKAVRAGDAPQFATAAVSAMRVACAPHYPAEPRALVGGDVLLLLPEAERSSRTGEVVRRFFRVTDEARFATVPDHTTELLALEPELERVLEQLEARL
jgi:hypothetical protein